MRRILILGSLNIDLVQRVSRLPRPGETLKGEDLQIFVGGKGANQACAAALLGGQTAMAGMVGTDVFADRLLEELRKTGVNTDAVQSAEGASGSASIFVLPNGENAITISPGANAKVSQDFALAATNNLTPDDFLLCQLEIPLQSVAAALKMARARGVTTILDPAPATRLSDDLLRSITILTPNQSEAALLLDEANEPADMAEAETAARRLQERGVPAVIIKMGAHGCFVAEGNECLIIPGYRVEAVDTTAAGDTFNGALAASLAEGASLPDAARFANAAAALSVTKAGAISSIPNRRQLEDFLAAAQPVRSR